MIPEVKAQWTAALRSGTYAQTRGFLRTEEGYCCLGVLCDLYRQAKDGTWQDRGEDHFCPGVPEEGVRIYAHTHRFSDQADCRSKTDLPIDVRKWSGLGAAEMTEPVMRMNDQGVPFADIADAIEAGACDIHPEHDA